MGVLPVADGRGAPWSHVPVCDLEPVGGSWWGKEADRGGSGPSGSGSGLEAGGGWKREGAGSGRGLEAGGRGWANHRKAPPHLPDRGTYPYTFRRARNSGKKHRT
ncbi:hypothetical protein SSP531S_37160 [Streptomyces spongiicola]|uniref:Uncharacterized protein n=1 Tax=Streptomyces spongiicola TaxID=1690221 RepID=A0A388T0G1_9ACTN|nr:hypothetical protein SSP531S_37160 [Streptomyces spongiicola]